MPNTKTSTFDKILHLVNTIVACSVGAMIIGYACAMIGCAIVQLITTSLFDFDLFEHDAALIVLTCVFGLSGAGLGAFIGYGLLSIIRTLYSGTEKILFSFLPDTSKYNEMLEEDQRIADEIRRKADEAQAEYERVKREEAERGGKN